MQKLVEPRFVESCKKKYIPRGGTFLSVDIKVMHNFWKIGTIVNIPTYECYV